MPNTEDSSPPGSPPPVSGQRRLKSFLIMAVPVAGLICAGTLMLGFAQQERQQRELVGQANLDLQLAGQSLNGELARPLLHLRSVAFLEDAIARTIDAPAGSDRSGMIDTFSSLISRNPEYVQMRWIGEDGREIVRVDRGGDGKPKRIPDQELQDKHDRYYFRDTMRLAPGEIFVSPLDLNIEHGKVDIPYNPMIRLGTRMFTRGGRSNGMLILNVSASRMLSGFARFGRNPVKLSLLNQEGFWLKSTRPEDEWGFMFGRKETFGLRHPEAWRWIKSVRAGEARLSDGYWLWDTVQVTPQDSPGVNAVEWKMVGHIGAEAWTRQYRQVWLPLTGGALALILIFSLGAWSLARAQLRRQQAELELAGQQQILRLNAELEARVRERTAELAEANRELERSNHDLDEFAYIASHDLKEPLRGIHNYASFLKEDYADRLDNEGRDFLDRLQRLAERQTELINQLLAYSRVGRVGMEMVPVDLNQLLDDIEKDLHVFLADSRVELRRPRALPTLECNRTRIGEVLQNLIVNAAKYNDKPEKWVEVGCDLGGPVPVLYVRDNGIGIAEQHRDSVFRIFKRLHEQSKFGGGVGAGLTIVKKIVERHGGRIWLESTPGEGTTFYFTLTGAT